MIGQTDLRRPLGHGLDHVAGVGGPVALGLVLSLLIAGCGSNVGSRSQPLDQRHCHAGDPSCRAATQPLAQQASSPPPTASSIAHLVVILQENHTFDTYFGRYCQGGAAPDCTVGRACCEAAPERSDSADGSCQAGVVTDGYNGDNAPYNDARTEFDRMRWTGATFAMDGYPCHDIAYAAVPDDSYAQAVYPDVAVPDDGYPLRTYHGLAHGGALADHYFQPIVGASSSNDMFLTRAGFVFQDNQAVPKEVSRADGREYADPTIGDLLDQQGVTWGVYMEGLDVYRAGKAPAFPDGFDPADNPFNYYRSTSQREVDYSHFAADLAAGSLPAVSLVRALGARSEHPGNGTSISKGQLFVKEALDAINGSAQAADTLVLVSWDEGGGYFDHVPPPTTFPDGTALPGTAIGQAGADVSQVQDGDHQATLPSSTSDPEYYACADNTDGQEYYGTRVPLLALGRFARKDYVSHVVMEHSSIVKFIEWNWLADARLGKRDLKVNNLGDLLDPAATGVAVPSTI